MIAVLVTQLAAAAVPSPARWPVDTLIAYEIRVTTTSMHTRGAQFLQSAPTTRAFRFECTGAAAVARRQRMSCLWLGSGSPERGRRTSDAPVEAHLVWRDDGRLLSTEVLGLREGLGIEDRLLEALGAMELQEPRKPLLVGASWLQGGNNAVARIAENPGATEIRHHVKSIDAEIALVESEATLWVLMNTMDDIGNRVEYAGGGWTRYDTARHLVLERHFALEPTRVPRDVRGPATLDIYLNLVEPQAQ